MMCLNLEHECGNILPVLVLNYGDFRIWYCFKQHSRVNIEDVILALSDPRSTISTNVPRIMRPLNHESLCIRKLQLVSSFLESAQLEASASSGSKFGYLTQGVGWTTCLQGLYCKTVRTDLQLFETFSTIGLTGAAASIRSPQAPTQPT
jgi:hypothetical protein